MVLSVQQGIGYTALVDRYLHSVKDLLDRVVCVLFRVIKITLKDYFVFITYNRINVNRD